MIFKWINIEDSNPGASIESKDFEGFRSEYVLIELKDGTNQIATYCVIIDQSGVYFEWYVKTYNNPSDQHINSNEILRWSYIPK